MPSCGRSFGGHGFPENKGGAGSGQEGDKEPSLVSHGFPGNRVGQEGDKEPSLVSFVP